MPLLPITESIKPANEELKVYFITGIRWREKNIKKRHNSLEFSNVIRTF